MSSVVNTPILLCDKFSFGKLTNKNSMMSVKFWLVVTFKSKRRNVFKKRLNKRQVFFNILFFKMCDIFSDTCFTRQGCVTFFRMEVLWLFCSTALLLRFCYSFQPDLFCLKFIKCFRARLRTKIRKEKDPDTQRFMSFLGKPSKKHFLHLGGHDQSSLHFSKTS